MGRRGAGGVAPRRPLGPVLGAAEVVASFDGPMGAYVHIPFCARICPFCPYNKVLARGDLPQRYLAALLLEIDRYRQAGAPGPDGFASVYIGGGTPTLFPEAIGEVLARLPSRGERAVEVLPTHATPQRLADLADAGITAVSIGAQSFHDEVLARLRRPHDGAASLAAVHAAHARFDLVDVDLIVDAALEDDPALAGAFLADLRTCFGVGVEQVSTYPLMRFGYTPFGAARHDRGREHSLLARATDLAGSMGYERRSVWTFNRAGAGTYTSITRRRFLGMGAGASSFTGRDFLVNHFGIATYMAAVDAGRPPIARRLHVGGLGGLGYDAFWQSYSGRIRPGDLAAAYGWWALLARTALVGLDVAGVVERDDGQYRPTRRGYDAYHDLERWVTYQMIEPLWAQMLAEHAREGAPVAWAQSHRARRGTIWPAVRWLLEREVATSARG